MRVHYNAINRPEPDMVCVQAWPHLESAVKSLLKATDQRAAARFCFRGSSHVPPREVVQQLPCASGQCVNVSSASEEDLDRLPCPACQTVTYCCKACMEQDAEQHAAACARYQQRCLSCGARDGLKWCAGCNQVMFCSSRCQRDAWATHQPVCAAVRR